MGWNPGCRSTVGLQMLGRSCANGLISFSNSGVVTLFGDSSLPDLDRPLEVISEQKPLPVVHSSIPQASETDLQITSCTILDLVP